MVSIGGVEPPRISPHEPESCASTNFAISTLLLNFQLPDWKLVSLRRNGALAPLHWLFANPLYGFIFYAKRDI